MDTTHRLSMPVYDLGCGGAGARIVERELALIHGVLRVYVNPATETVHIEYEPGQTDPYTIARAVERAGYRAGRPVEA